MQQRGILLVVIQGYLLSKISTEKHKHLSYTLSRTLTKHCWGKKCNWCYVCDSLEESWCFYLGAIPQCQHGNTVTSLYEHVVFTALCFSSEWRALPGWPTTAMFITLCPQWHVSPGPVKISNNALTSSLRIMIWARNIANCILLKLGNPAIKRDFQCTSV